MAGIRGAPISEPLQATQTALCKCGRTRVIAKGAPILVAACYCDDCQQGAKLIQSLPDAPAVQGGDGGTEYLLFRKDRVTIVDAAGWLRPYKIRENSATNRMVATCCNSALVLNFDDSKHWVNVYRSRCGATAPSLQMRICTRFAPEGVTLAKDAPQYLYYPPSLIGKLIFARLRMMVCA